LHDYLWYHDSCASYRITNNCNNNFSFKASYTGNEYVKLGNGAGMKILHIGHAKCHLPHTNTHFMLNQLLYVPKINKNLISVSKFARDNNIFFF